MPLPPIAGLWLIGSLALAFTTSISAQAHRLHQDWRWSQIHSSHHLSSEHVLQIVPIADPAAITPPDEAARTSRGAPRAYARLEQGVVWFDGYCWQSLGTADGLPAAVPSNLEIAGGSTVLIRYGPESTGRLFARLEGRFVEVPGAPGQVAPLSSGELLCGFNTPNGQQFEIFDGRSLRRLAVAPPISISPRTRIWADTRGGVLMSDRGRCAHLLNGQWTEVHGYPEGSRVLRHLANRSGQRISLVEDRDGNRVLLTFDLAPQHSSSPAWQREIPAGLRPVDIALGQAGELVMRCQGDRVFFYDLQSWTEVPSSIPALRHSRSLAFDARNRLWIATTTGLVLFDYGSDRWRTLMPGSTRPAAAPARILASRDGSVWHCYDGKIRQIADDGTIADHLPRGDGTADHQVLDLMEDRGGQVWLSLAEPAGGVYRWNGHHWTLYGTLDGITVPIHRFGLDRRGRVWAFPAAKSPGPRALQLHGKQFAAWSGHQSLQGSNVQSFAEGRAQDYWFGTDAGLLRHRGDELQHWTRSQGLPSDDIADLHFTADGRLWFSCSQRSVGYLDDQGRLGFPRDPLLQTTAGERLFIAQSSDGRLWFGTPHHLRSLFDGEWLHFDRSAGYSPDETVTASAAAGRLYYCSRDGSVTALNLAAIEVPAPRITFKPPFLRGNGATLSWTTEACYADWPAGEVHSQFRVDSRSWSPWSRTGLATLELAPGHHLLEVRSRNRFGHIGAVRSQLFEMPYSRLQDPRFLLPLSTLLLLLVGGGLLALRHQRRSTRELASKERRYRDLFENAKDIVFSIDESLCITDISPSIEEISGRPRQEFLGTPLLDLAIHDRERQHLLELLDRARSQRAAGTVQIAIEDNNGEPRVLEVSARACSSASGNSIQGIARDVSMRIELAQSRLDTYRLEAISQLSRGIAHDFNNILTIIRGHAEQVIDDTDDIAEEDREGLATILAATQRAELLTLQLMAQSRPEAQRPDCLDVTEVTHATLQTLSPLLPDNIRCCTELQKAAAPVHIDRNALEQIILNLCLNARDAMPQGGTLRVTVEDRRLSSRTQIGSRKIQPGRYVALTVTDTGRGMDSDTQDRVFEPFFTTKGPTKGNGLGLSTVQSTVARCGGYAIVESRLGYGSSFTVFLPWSDEIPRPPSQTAKAADTPDLSRDTADPPADPAIEPRD